jgi:hypothetical protein
MCLFGSNFSKTRGAHAFAQPLRAEKQTAPKMRCARPTARLDPYFCVCVTYAKYPGGGGRSKTASSCMD